MSDTPVRHSIPPPAGEEWFRALFENSADAMALIDPETGAFVDTNAASVRAINAPSREALIGRLPAEMTTEFQPDGRASTDFVAEMLRRVLRDGSHRFEWQMRRLDGTLTWSEIVATAITVGGRTLVLTTSRNIAERKRVEQELRVSELRWRRVFEQIPFSMQIFTPDGRTLSVNQAFEQLFQLTMTEVAGFNIRTDAQLEAAGFQPLIERAFAGETVTLPAIPFELKAHPGQPPRGTRWIGSTLFPVVNPDGSIIEVVCVHEDTTERRQAEEAVRQLNATLEQRIVERTTELRASEERFRRVYELSQLGICVVRWDGAYVDVNPAYCRMLGHPRERLLAGTLHDVTPPENQGHDLAALETLRQTGFLSQYRKEYLRSDGERITVIMNGMVVRSAKGQDEIWAFVEDITERRRAEQELQRALERERELSLLKTNFVSMVSHEFRTPLGIIQSSAEILDDYLDQLAPSERREQLSSIIRNARRMAGLMEEVLVLGRLDADRMQFRPSPLDLAALCRRLVDEVHSTHDCGVSIHFSTAGLPDTVIADEHLLRHILLNLLSNALKYSEPGQTAFFRARRLSDCIVFTIQDQGIGIPQAEQDHLFTAFQRGSNVGQRPGTGLGLVIVRRCLELHGGALALDSTPGLGTTATVTLPLNLPPQP